MEEERERPGKKWGNVMLVPGRPRFVNRLKWVENNRPKTRALIRLRERGERGLFRFRPRARGQFELKAPFIFPSREVFEQMCQRDG